MTTASPSALAGIGFGDSESELAATRRMLAAVPEEHFAWKPHPKSMSLGPLAFHIANLAGWQSAAITSDHFDLATAPAPVDLATATSDDLLARFDANAERAREAFAQGDPGTMGDAWSLKHGEHTVFTMPRAAVLRSIAISHLIHHRGQLSVYLRLLDVPVPGVYGPTADEAPKG